jgi:hypothetical protein
MYKKGKGFKILNPVIYVNLPEVRKIMGMHLNLFPHLQKQRLIVVLNIANDKQ